MSGPLRLSQYFCPSSYALRLKVDPRDPSFHGSVIIKGINLVTGRVIRLHAKDLEIHSLRVKIGRSALPDTSWQYSGQEMLVIHCPTGLKKQQAVSIIITFRGSVSSEMVGVYLCTPGAGASAEPVIATQFESHYARRAFPCIDEPSAKAIFRVTIETGVDNQVISNMPVAKESVLAGSKMVSFKDSPLMSTYLLAWVVGKMKCLSRRSNTGTEIRSWATEDKYRQTEYALSFAVRALEFLERYFDYPYPLAKMDLVALSDFSAGAMENWGICTFRETALLVDEHSDLLQKQVVASIVAHELAHQWFGNLVTMTWWDDLWLNEGFARWMETLVPDNLYPDWKLWDRFLAQEYAAAQSLDKLPSSQPLIRHIESPQDVVSSFDSISYDKGSIIVSMLAELVGHEAFRQSLSTYLKRYAYRSVTTKDFWETIAETSSLPVIDFIKSWTEKRGFPLVTADYRQDRLILQQQPYQSTYTTGAIKPNPTWLVPFRNGSDSVDFFDSPRFEMKLKPQSDVTHLSINPSHIFYYPTLYLQDRQLPISPDNDSLSISSSDIIGSIQDSFLLAKAGYLPTSQALQRLTFFSERDDSAIWIAIGSSLKAVELLLSGEDEVLFDHFAQSIVEKVYRSVSWEVAEHETADNEVLRPIILGLAVRFKLDSAIRQASRLYHESELDHLHPSIRPAVLRGVAINGNLQDYHRLLNQYGKAGSQIERETLAYGLLCFQPWSATLSSLEESLSDNVRPQDVLSWIAQILSHRRHRLEIWDWLTAHWPAVIDKIANAETLAVLPMILARSVNDPREIPLWQRLIKQPRLKVFSGNLRQSEDIIGWQMAWKEREQGDLHRWLSEQSG